ncbi:MAG: hypothetical protein GX793_08270 [Bacteroidales bacterium]|jgi:nitrite reductase/ring-hydroxylating ferredoxin subunit|nr:hypothetical protein [Bacteroidales bacterium]MCK9498076.1 hypothetical protein [Bacteroidales bacterium]MDY0313566.1 hypothetical protein [Bacteroidales bacterium]NLB86948.1 hypothetical protein [Bacteroidales bacterium]NLB87039.1 hypothetical protein [Bacteroidales bacterium]
MKVIFTKIIIFFTFVSFLTIIPACNHEERIPYAYVDFTIYLDMPQYFEVKTPGNFLYLTGGVKGIILYCEYADSYRAYERNCPYEPSNPSSILDVDSTGLFLVCRHCESKFLLMDGSVVNGPSKYPVLQYATYLEFGNKLSVFNTF